MEISVVLAGPSHNQDGAVLQQRCGVEITSPRARVGSDPILPFDDPDSAREQ
jgi:hypothetical protein